MRSSQGEDGLNGCGGFCFTLVQDGVNCKEGEGLRICIVLNSL